MSTSAPDFSGFTYSGPSSSAVQPASDSTGDQGILSGLSDVFSSVGAAVAANERAINAPSTRPILTAPGTVAYNPATGTYVPVGGIAAQSSMTPLILLLGLGLVVYLMMRPKAG